MARSGSEQALPLGLERIPANGLTFPRQAHHLALRGKSEAGMLGLRFWPVAAQVTWVGKVALEGAKAREY